MHANLSVDSLAKYLKGLVWLLGAAGLLLVGCLASFTYLQNQEQAAEIERVQILKERDRVTETDTLSPGTLRKAITVADIMRQSKRFHKQSVWVKGYLHLEFEGDALYWRKVDYQTHTYNSLYVRFSDSLAQTKPVAEYSDHYVVLKGTFDSTLSNIESGAIIEITSLNALQKSSQ